MNNNYINDESFSFDSFDNENNLNFNNISGLGESDYENEDLFGTEVSTQTSSERINNDYVGEPFNTSFVNVDDYDVRKATQVNTPNLEEEFVQDETNQFKNAESTEDNVSIDEIPSTLEESISNEEKIKEDNDTIDEGTIQSSQGNILTDTPIEELQKLTEYTEEKINSTDIKSLFDKVGVNVKEASDIFKKNTEMKEKIDSRFEELKKLQLEVEKSKKSQYDEINAYKEEVLSKLTEKKDEIEKRLNKLKTFQSTLEEEKAEFEKYKKQEKEEIARVQKEIQDAYDTRREELSHIEDVLRRQKDSLDEERNKLSLDIIQYESDKNELANNLLKFNEIVASFTNGMEKINKE